MQIIESIRWFRRLHYFFFFFFYFRLADFIIWESGTYIQYESRKSRAKGEFLLAIVKGKGSAPQRKNSNFSWNFLCGCPP